MSRLFIDRASCCRIGTGATAEAWISLPGRAWDCDTVRFEIDSGDRRAPGLLDLRPRDRVAIHVAVTKRIHDEQVNQHIQHSHDATPLKAR